jgi:hypothetical protein
MDASRFDIMYSTRINVHKLRINKTHLTLWPIITSRKCVGAAGETLRDI